MEIVKRRFRHHTYVLQLISCMNRKLPECQQTVVSMRSQCIQSDHGISRCCNWLLYVHGCVYSSNRDCCCVHTKQCVRA